MKITVKLVVKPGDILTKVITDVDYVSVGKRSLSYRLRDNEKWIHSIPYNSVENIRIDED